MLFTIVFSIVFYPDFLSATIKSIASYENARYEPNDARYIFSQSSPINSTNSCICLCLSMPICSMATYFAMNQTCSLYVGKFSKEELRVTPRDLKATFYHLGNSSASNLKIFDPKNETIYPIWNTTASGDSLLATRGYATGTYWPSQPVEEAFDKNFASSYTNHGHCNRSTFNISCGENTGLYLTLDDGPVILLAFYFITGVNYVVRDPLTITIEGSNANQSVLNCGSSWTLIYNGSTGLSTNLGRTKRGTIQLLANSSSPFTSYRLLITSKRGEETSVSFSEFVMIYKLTEIFLVSKSFD